MSKFNDRLKAAYRAILLEADEQPPVDPNAVTPEQPAPTGADAVAEPPAEPEPQKEVEQLSPEGMVFLVRMLKSALMIDSIDPAEEKIIADLKDINEVNAKEALNKLFPIISKYAPSVGNLPKLADF